jgi:hypothetical protein
MDLKLMDDLPRISAVGKNEFLLHCLEIALSFSAPCVFRTHASLVRNSSEVEDKGITTRTIWLQLQVEPVPLQTK